MDSAPELPNGLLSWNPQIKVPENGILLTSTSIENDLPDTRWFTTSGIDLQNPNDSTDMYVGHVRTGSVKCSEKEFKYQIWKLVDKRWTTGPLSRELDSLELMLTDYLCKK
ncbi:MAG: hypothetical protein HY277_00520 [Ignavibacteriales bacterium]|nr:hypothetical protein [Ignavibacteriales bacterium]